MPSYAFDWSELAFGNKKPIKELNAIFIAAPREVSERRFKEVVKTYLPKGNLMLGLSKEPFIDGFEDQPQFTMLAGERVQKIIDQVNSASKTHHIYTLRYFQRELPYLIEKLGFSKVLLVRGSWKHVFHTSPAYYSLVAARIPYEMLSPFHDEQEARTYEQHADEAILRRLDALQVLGKRSYTEAELLQIAALSATRSYDYSFQTGAALAKRLPSGNYRLLSSTYNKVVPYQTYAMLHGASREEHFSPPNDLNHYDAVHAEVWLLIEALKASQQGQPVSLKGTTLCINLMPCPSCARMLSQTDITEFVYSIDHSDGYAIRMFEAAGKKVRRVVI